MSVTPRPLPRCFKTKYFARQARKAVLEFLFGKKDAANITRGALDGFRTLADTYAVLRTGQLAKLLEGEALKEICNEPTRNNQIAAEHAKA